MRKDGDICSIFTKWARNEQVKAIRVSKVKGHVTDDQVAAGAYNQRDAEHHDTADKLVTMGIKAHANDLLNFATLQQERAEGYVAFVTKLCMYIVDVLRAVHCQRTRDQCTQIAPNQSCAHTQIAAVQ